MRDLPELARRAIERYVVEEAGATIPEAARFGHALIPLDGFIAAFEIPRLGD